MVDTVTLAEAAHLLGVHYMTAYKYVRTGRIQAVKVGGLWSVPVIEINAFRSTDVLPRVRRETHPELIAARLIDGDDAGAYALLVEALSSGAGPDEVYLDLLGGALASIGARWDRGEVSIADEHIASASAFRAMARLGVAIATKGRTRGTVLLSSVAGDLHALPSAMLRDLLRSRRFDVLDLGANTPAHSIVEAAASANDLVAIGIVATTPGSDSTIAATLSLLAAEVSSPVVLGGRAIRGESHARTLGPCFPSASARQALELFGALRAASVGP